MDSRGTTHRITDVETLRRIYGLPSGAAVEKEIDYIHPHYRRLIEASPFVVLATSGPDGLDTSPRGDMRGFVFIEDEKTLLIPDRRGNNRIDSLSNIVVDPRVALLFLVPGVGETLRVNGRAYVTNDPALLERFGVEGRLPRSVIVVQVETVFFQCSRAVFRAKLWEAEQQIDRRSLPSLGRMISDISQARIDARQYDDGLYDRLKSSLY
jgi:PPOX class probable FMN-dependent enzyme